MELRSLTGATLPRRPAGSWPVVRVFGGVLVALWAVRLQRVDSLRRCASQGVRLVGRRLNVPGIRATSIVADHMIQLPPIRNRAPEVFVGPAVSGHHGPRSIGAFACPEASVAIVGMGAEPRPAPIRLREHLWHEARDLWQRNLDRSLNRAATSLASIVGVAQPLAVSGLVAVRLRADVTGTWAHAASVPGLCA